MYADRVEAGTKRSVKDRLYGNVAAELCPLPPSARKRQCQGDVKWRHDLYVDRGESQISKAGVGAEDLRGKLQNRSTQQASHVGKELGCQGLSEKQSGTVQQPPTSTAPPKAKPVSERAKPVKKSAPSIAEIAPDTKKASVSTSRKKSQKESGFSVDSLLKSLGLEKYSLTFLAEEVDMAALRHMTEDDLRTLGIPMGPRKKILLALSSKA